MTVTTTYEPARYTGDGSTTEFALGHLVYESSHLSITIDDVLTSAWSAATYGSASGVTVTFDSAPANGAVVVIQRIVPYTQDTDLENFDGNPADVTEKQFDLLAMADQQIAEESGRTIVAPIGTTLTSNEITGTIDTNVRLLTITAAGPATSTLGSISTTIDTVFTSEAAGDLLMYDGSNWVNETTLTGDYTFSGDNTFSGEAQTFKMANDTFITARNAADDGDINLVKLSGSDVFEVGADLSGAGTYKGVNFVDPTSAQDLATKAYVDASAMTTYSDTEASIGNGTTYTFTHGLGGLPDVVQASLICTATNAGYAVGDEINVDSIHSGVDSSLDARGATVFRNTTQLGVVFAAGYGVFNKSTNAFTTLDLSDWDLKVKAIRF